MLTIEILKKYADKNQIHQYEAGDSLGVFYKKIIEIIVEWERQAKKGFTTSIPPTVLEQEFSLALSFINLCGYSEEKQQKDDLNKELSAWAVSKAKEYFNKRMNELEVEKDDLLTTVLEGGEPSQVPVFSCDIKTGNIEILVTRLDGEYITYEEKQEEKTPEEFVKAKTEIYKIIRLAQPKPGQGKYSMPKGEGTYPFFPEILKKAYKDGERLETIFITEGAFKAFKATKEGIPTIGLSSITHYRCAESSKKKPALHKDIVEFIKKCEVKNVVVLWDGDCKNINVKDLELEQELTERPNAFFQAAKTARDLVLNKFKVKDKEGEYLLKVWFTTIRTNVLPNNPKGIDDLLVLNKGLRQVIAKNALKLDGKENPFFFVTNITNNTDTLHEFFGLKTADQFYSKHNELIGSKEFLFNGNRYRYSEVKNQLVLLQPTFLKHLRWIGDDFYQNIEVPIPNKDGNLVQKELRPVRKSTLQDLHGRDFVKYMVDKHYMGFCNIPSHFDYQFEIETASGKYYNKYFPFEWTPIKGKCDTIIDFVKHIFGDQWEMGLDYIQLLLLQPMQKLPVIVLYSPENATGKSKFGELISQIFKNNTVFINNDDLKSEFGLERFVDKLVAICEETLFERKKDVEKVKFITTAEEAVGINPKGMSFYTLHTYVKMIFTSNNLRMIYATEHDERFWVIRVPKPKNPDHALMEKMRIEIPSFVDFLQHRKLSTEKKSRMWFDKDLIRTETLEEVIRVNEHTDLQEIRRKIEDYFIDFPNEKELILSTKDIIEELMPGKTGTWIEEVLTRMGVERHKVNDVTVVKRSYFMKKETSWERDTPVYKDVKIPKAPQRVWIMPREKFISKSISYEHDLDEKAIEEINNEVPF